MTLSTGQKHALQKILPIAQIALSSDKQDLPIKPRTHTLMCASSGTGKSYLMAILGDLLEVPVLHLNCSSWNPVGSKCDTPTWERVVEFLKENPRGIIVLDEIDKIASKQSDWMGHLRLELYDLLDGRISSAITVYDNSTNDDEDDMPW